MKNKLLGKKRQNREDEEEDRVRFKFFNYLKGNRGINPDKTGKRRKTK